LHNDPYGQAVDRCARILERCRPGLTLYGAGFYKSTANKSRFHSAGRFKLRGFPEPEELFFREPDTSVHPAGYLQPLLETLNGESAQRRGYRYVPRVFCQEDITSWAGRARPFLLRELLNVPALPWSYQEFAEKVWSAANEEEMFDYYGMLVDWEGEFHKYSRSESEITVWVHTKEPKGPTAFLSLPLFMFDVVRLLSKGDRMKFRGILSRIDINAIELNYVDVIYPEAPS
jgi:hypothetical protein